MQRLFTKVKDLTEELKNKQPLNHMNRRQIDIIIRKNVKERIQKRLREINKFAGGVPAKSKQIRKQEGDIWLK